VTAFLVALVISEVALLATTVYLHRGLAHRALDLGSVAGIGMRTLLWITTGLRRQEWVAVHRKHHANVDTPEDPHSPKVLGFWRVQLTNAALYRRTARDGVTVDRYTRDIPRDVLDRLLFDRAPLGLAIGITFLCLIFGWKIGLLVAVLHAGLYLSLSASVNAVGHTVGRRPHDNLATNSQMLALVTVGEGLHNNHHARPTSARLAIGRGEIDPAWWFVRALVALRLARLRRVSADVT
jgi:stearoyl-CoA desaturase (delta-9 desaturase)